MKLDKRLPHNIELEQEILGMLLDFDNVKDLTKYLTRIKPDDFYKEINSSIYIAIEELAYSDIVPDLVNVSAKFPDLPTYIAEIVVEAPTNANIDSKIKLLKELSLRRKVIIECNAKLEEFYDVPDVNDALDSFVTELSTINGAYKPRKEFNTKDTVKEVADMIRKTALGQSTQIVPYCIPAIDNRLTLLRKQMHVLGANSGIGKTSFVLSAINNQMQSGVKTIIFCGESSRHELLERLISMRINKPFMWITQGMQGATTIDIKNYTDAMQLFINNADKFIIYGKGDYEHSLMGIKDIMQSETTKNGQFDMIYIDYLQNMKPPKGARTQEERVSLNVQGLNNVIADYNVAGTVLSQVNREASKISKPYMENLKYASTIENEAHVITFLHRPKDAEPDTDGILETEWYSDKTRVQKGFYTRLAFVTQRAEYCGIYGATNNDNPNYDKQYSSK